MNKFYESMAEDHSRLYNEWRLKETFGREYLLKITKKKTKKKK